MKPFLLTLIALFTAYTSVGCGFNGSETNAGTLSPAAGYQTQSNVTNGQYFAVSVNCGDTYNFNFCNNGGASSWDTQITILQTNGTTELAYNDDNCGLQSDVSWTANFTGTVYVLITEYFCNFDGTFTGATLAYNVTPGSLSGNASFTLTANNCNSASATITGDTGGSFAFSPAPGDAAIVDPVTGTITNGTPGATYTVAYTVNCTSSTENITLPSTGNSSFSMNVVCGGANATITGDAGGTFAFNPVPGDGAQVNTSTGQVTNGTAGTSYTVQYTVCGSSSTQSFTVLDDNCWTLNGDAQYITVNGEQCIQLTDEINNQTGCAWNGSQIDFNQNFTLTLDYYFGNNIGGADGNTFTFQPSASTACGQDGGQLGAGGIPNALAIEFDTYDNDNPTHLYDMSCDHIAVEIDGNMNGPSAPLCGAVCAKPGGGNIDDGGLYQVDIAWDAPSNTLNIYFNGILRLTCVNDFVTNAFAGQNMVYWGATSATGGLNNQQYFCPSTIVILPVTLTRFESTCTGKEEVFTWTTQTEENTDYFQLQYTYDGLVFKNEGTFDAAGNSETPIDYTTRVIQNDPKQRYYRLKVVDVDGNFEYTDLIAGKNCAKSNVAIKSIEYAEQSIVVNVTSDANYAFVNSIGQLILKGTAKDGKITLEKGMHSTGVYYLTVITSEGQSESEKILID